MSARLNYIRLFQVYFVLNYFSVILVNYFRFIYFK